MALNLTIAIAFAICFLVVRLGLDFDEMWRTPRPYLESCAAGMVGVALFSLFWLNACDQPVMAVLSALLFTGAAKPPQVQVSLRERKAGHCECGYPSDFDTCPECGRSLTEPEPRAESGCAVGPVFFLVAVMLALIAIGVPEA